MFKSLLLISALSVLAVYCAPGGWPNSETRAELQATGLSTQATNGIMRIANDYAPLKPTKVSEIDRKTARPLFDQFIGQVETFIKSQSQADQAAYEAFISKKKAEFEAQIGN